MTADKFKRLSAWVLVALCCILAGYAATAADDFTRAQVRARARTPVLLSGDTDQPLTVEPAVLLPSTVALTPDFVPVAPVESSRPVRPAARIRRTVSARPPPPASL